MSKEERVKAVIEVEPIDFPETTISSYMSTITLSKYVNTLFNKVFKDYLGCKIYPVLNDQNSMRHPVRCELYFTLGSDNMHGARISAFSSVQNPEKPEVGANYTSYIGIHNARLKSLNSAAVKQDAIDILKDLLWYEVGSTTKETAEAYSNRSIIREQSTPVGYAMNARSEIITPVVAFVDINKIMHLLFSGKDDKTDEYMVSPIRSIAAMNPQPLMYGQVNQLGQQSENFLYSIAKLNRDDFADMMNEVGVVDKTGHADCFVGSF